MASPPDLPLIRLVPKDFSPTIWHDRPGKGRRPTPVRFYSGVDGSCTLRYPSIRKFKTLEAREEMAAALKAHGADFEVHEELDVEFEHGD